MAIVDLGNGAYIIYGDDGCPTFSEDTDDDHIGTGSDSED